MDARQDAMRFISIWCIIFWGFLETSKHRGTAGSMHCCWFGLGDLTRHVRSMEARAGQGQRVTGPMIGPADLFQAPDGVGVGAALPFLALPSVA